MAGDTVRLLRLAARVRTWVHPAHLNAATGRRRRMAGSAHSLLPRGANRARLRRVRIAGATGTALRRARCSSLGITVRIPATTDAVRLVHSWTCVSQSYVDRPTGGIR